MKLPVAALVIMFLVGCSPTVVVVVPTDTPSPTPTVYSTPTPTPAPATTAEREFIRLSRAHVNNLISRAGAVTDALKANDREAMTLTARALVTEADQWRAEEPPSDRVFTLSTVINSTSADCAFAGETFHFFLTDAAGANQDWKSVMTRCLNKLKSALEAIPDV